MTKIDLFEKAIAEKANDLSDRGINHTMFWAYRSSQQVDNYLLDFNEVIWDKDIVAIARCLDENGITEFTISSNFSGLISTLAEFDKLGFKIAGVTEVKVPYTDIFTLDYKRIPAVRMVRA